MMRPGSLRPAVGPVGYREHSAGFGGVMGVIQRCCKVVLVKKPASAPLGQIPPSVTESGVMCVSQCSARVPPAR
jgi:hypothetical protein